MKSIEILTRLLQFFGYLGIVGGFLFLISAIFSPTLFLLPGLTSTQQFLYGTVYLFLAQGLSKKEKWAFYIGFIIFSLSIFISITQTFFVGGFVYLISLIISIFLLFLLIKGKQQFLEQPKEKIAQWFRKPHFMIVVAGTLISYIISVIASILLKGVSILQVL